MHFINGGIILNVWQNYHYWKDSEIQPSANEGSFVLFTSSNFFSAANIISEANWNYFYFFAKQKETNFTIG